MSDTDDSETYYATLGLPPNATFAQVKARFNELNEAYLKILEQSRKESVASKHLPAGSSEAEHENHASSAQETHTEPIASLKEKLAKGKINRAQFESLAKARYAYLHNKPFADLTDAEFEERINGFEKLKLKL